MICHRNIGLLMPFMFQVDALDLALKLDDQSAGSYWAMKGKMWKSITFKMYRISIDCNVKNFGVAPAAYQEIN